MHGDRLTDLMTFQSKRTLLWLFNTASKNETYLGRQVKLPDNFCPIKKCGISRQIFLKVLNMKFYVCPSCDSHADTCGDRWIGMTKVMDNCCDYVDKSDKLQWTLC